MVSWKINDSSSRILGKVITKINFLLTTIFKVHNTTMHIEASTTHDYFDFLERTISVSYLNHISI